MIAFGPRYFHRLKGERTPLHINVVSVRLQGSIVWASLGSLDLLRRSTILDMMYDADWSTYNTCVFSLPSIRAILVFSKYFAQSLRPSDKKRDSTLMAKTIKGGLDDYLSPLTIGEDKIHSLACQFAKTYKHFSTAFDRTIFADANHRIAYWPREGEIPTLTLAVPILGLASSSCLGILRTRSV
jgi:hypothetical protein